jgi:hypothetical protein
MNCSIFYNKNGVSCDEKEFSMTTTVFSVKIHGWGEQDEQVYFVGICR